MNDSPNSLSTVSIISNGLVRRTSQLQREPVTHAERVLRKWHTMVWMLVVSLFATAINQVQASDQGAAPAADAPQPALAKVEEAEDLLAGEFMANWKLFSSDPQTDAATVWMIMQDPPDADRILICTGAPKGFAFTTAEYSDFELSLEWRYPEDPSGNSGVLIYTQNEPRIWPTAIQIQLHQPEAGSIFPSGDAVSDNTLDSAPDLAGPVKTWNACRILSREGRITVEINGKRAGEVTGAKPAVGRIALQSEGSVVHFRKIRLKKLTEVPKAESPEVKTPDPAGGAPNPDVCPKP